MSKNAEQPASWRAFTKSPSRRAQPEEPVVLDFGARAQNFLARITPLSADLATHRPHSHPRPPEASQTLPSRSPQAQSPLHPGHRQARPLQVPGARSAPWSQITWSCAQGKCAPVSASAISRSIRKKPARWNAAYHERIHLRPIQSHFAAFDGLPVHRVADGWAKKWTELDYSGIMALLSPDGEQVTYSAGSPWRTPCIARHSTRTVCDSVDEFKQTTLMSLSPCLWTRRTRCATSSASERCRLSPE
jgi:hypothetical protein